MNFFEHPDKFVNRHIGPGEKEISEMLEVVGSASLDKLIEETIPASIRLKEELSLGETFTEYWFLEKLKRIARRNKVFKSYIGMGYYNTTMPAVIQRNILENPGWYTQYTPYQAEIAQGRLEALINFQTAISDLTGLPIANASLLDEGTAAGEAMSMFHSLRKNKNASKFFVSDDVFPQTKDVLLTRANPHGIEVVTGDWRSAQLDESYFGLLVQYPSGFGEVNDYREFFNNAAAKGIYKIAAADLLGLALLTPPGEFGADCVVGSSQRFGIPMGYGGPHAAFFATKDDYKRVIPGRIIGISVDTAGNSAYRMALQTREQHIRREKATSNICTAQVLLAVMAGMYAVYHGPAGIRAIASRIHNLAKLLDKELKKLGFANENKYFFDTLSIKTSLKDKIREIAESKEINFRYAGKDTIGISLNEPTDVINIIEILKVFAEAAGKTIDEKVIRNSSVSQEFVFPKDLVRNTKYLQHPVFSSYHSETEMMRYIKRLENKDLSLVHSMIPLGSCTMKLNATTEMIGITWPEFAKMHPFAPAYQAEGYHQIFSEIEEALCAITGFAGVSLQPNSGAQGEYSGLMVIRQYFNDRKENHRNICLIPASAHGTNPASAVMAGYKVVVVDSDKQGYISIDDLKKKAEQYKDTLAALMITYPSTHGVFEESVKEICKIVHQFGGQVYMDGANMNAQVGLTSPAMIGADICHINLHKTFAIPHGGGGPGMGPIAAAAHLKQYLPNHPVVDLGHLKGITAVSSAPWGSADVLIISYAYIKMMGGTGLTKASEAAILNANYIKAKLENYYPVLYTGEKGRVAHELIFDMRNFKHSANIEVEDIAKRLMDYGYHAPTVSFPVPGTLMIEPTESESKAELDRFCTALISIREEITRIENGFLDKADNMLKNSPHTMLAVVSDNWNHSYSREEAAFPAPWLRNSKFWPSTGRINNAYGDRNLVCTCNPASSYAEEAVS